MTDDVKVTDQEAREWAANLSDADKDELKRQALLKRAIDLAQPDQAPDVSNMSDGELENFKRKNGFYR
jgi:hypothetical protein